MYTVEGFGLQPRAFFPFGEKTYYAVWANVRPFLVSSRTLVCFSSNLSNFKKNPKCPKKSKKNPKNLKRKIWLKKKVKKKSRKPKQITKKMKKNVKNGQKIPGQILKKSQKKTWRLFQYAIMNRGIGTGTETELSKYV